MVLDPAYRPTRAKATWRYKQRCERTGNDGQGDGLIRPVEFSGPDRSDAITTCSICGSPFLFSGTPILQTLA
jgi:hypothetical protein